MKNKIFKIASLTILLALIFFYGYRLIHYYKIYNPKGYSNNNPVEQLNLYKKIINNSYTDNSLIKDGKSYVFSGNITNNYVEYSGIIWQIISINENKEIKMVSKNNILLLANNETFDTSYIKEYLNDKNSILYKSLESPEAYLVNTSVCLDNITDIDSLTCNQKKKYLIGMLSLNDYALTGGINGFLNNNSNFWLSNYNNDSYYYVSNNNEIETTKISHIYGVRPVVTLSSEIIYTNGNGSINNPYQLGEEKNNILNQKNINGYVTFGDKIWRIIEQNDIGTKLVLNDALDPKQIYDAKETNYEKSSIYNYLNNDFYNSLDKDKIVKGKWYVGYYNALNDYDYKTIYDKYFEAYVGLLNINDLFVSEYNDNYTLTPINEISKTIYVLTEDGLVYSDYTYREKDIKPVIYLNSNLKIKNGTGSLTDPYVLE